MRRMVLARREDQDASVELLPGVQRRSVIHPETDARDLLSAASAKFDVLADAADNPHERGFWAPLPGTDGTLRRNSGLHPHPRGRETRDLGARALHPGRG